MCRSHDRALPEIPASASGVASTDDDDEEDEGHYDVISKSRRAAAANMPPNGRTAQKPRFCHPYEVVAGDLYSATYAGIRDELEAAVSRRSSGRGRGNSSRGGAAAVAREIPDQLYAGITDDAKVFTQASRPSALLSEITSTYSTVVSNQQLRVSDHIAESDRGMVAGSMRASSDAESPLLPPRNGNFDTVDDGAAAVAANSVPLTAAMSLMSASTANGNPNPSTTMAMHIQELQLLHNSANADAMPVSGMICCFCNFAL